MVNIQDSFFIVDKDGVVVFTHKEVLNILGYKDFTGRKIKDVFSEFKMIFNLWKECNERSESITKEIDTWIKDKTISLTISPYVLLNKDFTGSVFIIRDLTSLKRLENIQKDFITNVSHELRTPLTSIKMAAETLQMGALSNEKLKEKFLSNIQREADRLTRLINELLLVSNVDNKLPSLTLSKFDPVKLFQDIITTMEHHSELNDIKLISDFPSNLPELEADRDKLNQVLINLIDNAIKCNKPNGSVTLHARQFDNETLEIKVIDTGIGIPEIDRVRIFERFYRVDKSRSRVTGGTGLGLSIVKDIINAHGGTIEVVSTVDIGTTFIIKIPFKAKTL